MKKQVGVEEQSSIIGFSNISDEEAEKSRSQIKQSPDKHFGLQDTFGTMF